MKRDRSISLISLSPGTQTFFLQLFEMLKISPRNSFLSFGTPGFRRTLDQDACARRAAEQWFSNLDIRIGKEGMFQHKSPGPSCGGSSCGGLGGAQALAFLTSFQVRLKVPVRGPHIENHCA